MTHQPRQPMRVLVCGGRDFADYEMLREALECLLPISVLIHGCARGADELAGRWARRHDVRVESYPANWAKLGPAAGPFRNKQMLREGKPELVVAFPGGKGTANMVKIAREANIPVINVRAVPPGGPR